MKVLILILIFGIGAAYFATQNTALTTLYFGRYAVEKVPQYFIVLGAILVGLLVASLFTALDYISTKQAISHKDEEIKSAKQTVAELTRDIHQLKLENAELTATHGETVLDKTSL